MLFNTIEALTAEGLSMAERVTAIESDGIRAQSIREAGAVVAQTLARDQKVDPTAGRAGRFRVRFTGLDFLEVVRGCAVISAIGQYDCEADPTVLAVSPRTVDALNAANIRFELALAKR